MTTPHESAIDALRKRVPNARARVGVILGSGWSSLTDHVTNAQKIPYAELPGFPRASIAGHSGALVLGKIGEQEVAVLGGRKHVYEEGDVKAMQVPILTLRALGCETLVQTNAAGSLDARMPPGSLMAITDHINLPQRSPLVGENGSDRFVSMVDAYDPQLRRAAQKVAQRAAVDLHEGVYVWCLGPQFETPAEIRLCVQVGGRAVGMSTVPETILARRAGMKVLALSLMTNMAAGLSDEDLTHAHTLETAGRVAETATRLLSDVIQEIAP